VTSAGGRIVVLNGAPRSGKSSIVAAIQETFDGVWMNLGVDVFVRCVTPPRWRPGMGLRPGGERADLEALVPALYGALYDSVVAHSRHGLDVVVDIGHHDGYTRPLGTLVDAARRLAGFPALLVGVRCPIDVVMQRRDEDAARSGEYATSDTGGGVPEPVRRWQDAVHDPGIYDVEVDTSELTPAQCAQRIHAVLEHPPRPTAFERLAPTSDR
jgi:chloramphenicol 3-O phosphotransferase